MIQNVHFQLLLSCNSIGVEKCLLLVHGHINIGNDVNTHFNLVHCSRKPKFGTQFDMHGN